jgi:hypothetical protein|tara:strand:- start:27906 stop:28364 length:459 start_codon:yes stop_codon:yes gene_type:complete
MTCKYCDKDNLEDCPSPNDNYCSMCGGFLQGTPKEYLDRMDKIQAQANYGVSLSKEDEAFYDGCKDLILVNKDKENILFWRTYKALHYLKNNETRTNQALESLKISWDEKVKKIIRLTQQQIIHETNGIPVYKTRIAELEKELEIERENNRD